MFGTGGVRDPVGEAITPEPAVSIVTGGHTAPGETVLSDIERDATLPEAEGSGRSRARR